jgi:hypothetical protein
VILFLLFNWILAKYVGLVQSGLHHHHHHHQFFLFVFVGSISELVAKYIAKTGLHPSDIVRFGYLSDS